MSEWGTHPGSHSPHLLTEPGSAILTAAEMRAVIDALDELADMLAHGAMATEPANESMFVRATTTATLSQALKDRMGNESEWTR